MGIGIGDLFFSNESIFRDEGNLSSFWLLSNVMEEFVSVSSLGDSWHLEEFLLDIDDSLNALNNEWDLLLNEVLLELVEGKILSGGDFVWDEDLGGVALEELGNVWLLDGDLVWDLLPLGLFESALDRVWLLLVLSDSNLAGDDVWNSLDDGVVDSLGGFVWDGDFLLNWYLVVDSVWNLGGDDVWDAVGNSVWDLSGGLVWDLNLNLVWNLSLNSVLDFSCNLNWLKSGDFVLLSDVLGLSKLVWNLLSGHNWDLLGDLVFFSDVFSDSENGSIIRRISSGEFGVVTNLGPSVSNTT